jgi:hypothetical protein
MHNSGLEELARHRQRELLDTATYIHNARRAQRRARRNGAARAMPRAVAGWFARLAWSSRRQPKAVVPVPPRPSGVLHAHAVTARDTDAGSPKRPADDDYLVAC